MLERIATSWRLVGEAWTVLKQDRALVLFPILSGLFSLIVSVSFLVPLLLLHPFWEAGRAGGEGAVSRFRGTSFDPVHWLVLFLFYLATYFVVTFFSSGLVACVRIRFAGGNPTFQDGISFSLANIGRIFQWALVSATVGVLLRFIQERASWVGRLVVGLVGIAWTLATAFVVPVLVYEQVGPIEAIKRSAETFRRTWGETVVANVGIGAVFGVLTAAGFVILLGGIALAVVLSASAALAISILIGTAVVCGLYWIALAVIQSALQGIFLTACYQYATTGTVPAAFTPQYVVAAWQPKS
ncbi:MAG TPA: DUF6159 family protein [Armatimonadota bacterium]|nr:DUF6159 family protein [Armatimonadota bacterium]